MKSQAKHTILGRKVHVYKLENSSHWQCSTYLEGADIYQIAKNCRTSVEMIEKHYAVYIKDRIDTRAINVRRSN